MAEDDKKSFWASLPGVLTGLAAVLTAAGALIYHNQTKGKPRPKPEPIQQEATTQGEGSKPSTTEGAGSKPSPEELAPPTGFQEQAPYGGDCANPPAGSACIRFRDGYQWLVQDMVKAKHEEVGSWGNHQVVEARGKQNGYQHVLGTQYVKTVAK